MNGGSSGAVEVEVYMLVRAAEVVFAASAIVMAMVS